MICGLSFKNIMSSRLYSKNLTTYRNKHKILVEAYWLDFWIDSWASELEQQNPYETWERECCYLISYASIHDSMMHNLVHAILSMGLQHEDI